MSVEEVCACSSKDAGKKETLDTDQVTAFVALLTLNVLRKCGVTEKRMPERWEAHTTRLLSGIVDGLTIRGGFCPDPRDIRRLSKVVVKDLKKKFGDQLETVLLLQHQSVDAAFIQCVREHIKNHAFSARPSKNADLTYLLLTSALKLLIIAGTILTASFLILVFI